MADPEHVKELFARYARLRQSLASREEAWKRVKPDAERLLEEERKRVMALIRDWEIIEGHRYKVAYSEDPHATIFKAPLGLSEARERLKEDQLFQARLRAEADADRDETKEVVLTGPRRPGQLSIEIDVTDCANCHHPNPPDVMQCVNCGAELSRTRDMTGEAQRISFLTGAPVEVSNLKDMVLHLEFEAGQILRVAVEADQLVFGRTAAGGLMPPDIDLTAFGAQQKGVSRFHASLQRRGDVLLLTDLQSLNHTYVNGQRVHPHEVRALNSGDELRLGQLTMRVQILKGETC